jgi:hypothetical protein
MSRARWMAPAAVAVLAVALAVWWPHVRDELFIITGNRDEAGAWYGLWSGFGGALPDVLILTALAGWLYHNNCHQHRCWRVGRHPVGDTGIRVCRRHHPVLGARGKLTRDAIAEIREQDRAA